MSGEGTPTKAFHRGGLRGSRPKRAEGQRKEDQAQRRRRTPGAPPKSRDPRPKPAEGPQRRAPSRRPQRRAPSRWPPREARNESAPQTWRGLAPETGGRGTSKTEEKGSLAQGAAECRLLREPRPLLRQPPKIAAQKLGESNLSQNLGGRFPPNNFGGRITPKLWRRRRLLSPPPRPLRRGTTREPRSGPKHTALEKTGERENSQASIKQDAAECRPLQTSQPLPRLEGMSATAGSWVANREKNPQSFTVKTRPKNGESFPVQTRPEVKKG